MPYLIQQLLDAIRTNCAGPTALRRILESATQDQINECYGEVPEESAEDAALVRDTLAINGMAFPPYVEPAPENTPA